MIDIERLQRTLENAPQCRVEEVSTLEAIRMLAPQIHAMQTKGYALGAIAEMLSGNGVPVTGTTLKSYLNEVKTAGGRKSDRRRKMRCGPHSEAKVTKPAPAVTVPAFARDGFGDVEGDGPNPGRGERPSVGVRAERGHERHLRVKGFGDDRMGQRMTEGGLRR